MHYDIMWSLATRHVTHLVTLHVQSIFSSHSKLTKGGSIVPTSKQDWAPVFMAYFMVIPVVVVWLILYYKTGSSNSPCMSLLWVLLFFAFALQGCCLNFRFGLWACMGFGFTCLLTGDYRTNGILFTIFLGLAIVSALIRAWLYLWAIMIASERTERFCQRFIAPMEFLCHRFENWLTGHRSEPELPLFHRAGNNTNYGTTHMGPSGSGHVINIPNDE